MTVYVNTGASTDPPRYHTTRLCQHVTNTTTPRENPPADASQCRECLRIESREDGGLPTTPCPFCREPVKMFLNHLPDCEDAP